MVSLNNLNKYVCIMKLCKVRHRVELQQNYCIYPQHILEGSIYPAGWQNRPRCLNLDHDDDNGGVGDDSNDLLHHDTSLSYDNFLRALNPSAPTSFICTQKLLSPAACIIQRWPNSSHPCRQAGLTILRKLLPKTGLSPCKWPCTLSNGKFYIRTTYRTTLKNADIYRMKGYIMLV